MKTTTFLTLLVAATTAKAADISQCPPNSTGVAFCAGISLQTNIIYRCNAGRTEPGNCNDNLAGVPPIGVKTFAPCYETSPTAGDAICTFNNTIYPGNGSAPFPIPSSGSATVSMATATDSSSTAGAATETATTTTVVQGGVTTTGTGQVVPTGGAGGGSGASNGTVVVASPTPSATVGTFPGAAAGGGKVAGAVVLGAAAVWALML